MALQLNINSSVPARVGVALPAAQQAGLDIFGRAGRWGGSAGARGDGWRQLCTRT